jgi:phage terminase large subunit
MQWALHDALDAHRFVVAVCHRRMGKTVCAVNHLLKAALLCPRQRPRFHYIAPTYRQGKAAGWDYLKHYASDIPGWQKNESELRVDLPNGGQVQILGADNPDSMRGIYSDGAVFDEYGLQPANVFTEVMRPAFADREGWALFIGTPNGKNQFYDIAEQAKVTPGWAFLSYKASETQLIPESELASSRLVMTQDEYRQEFECSFEASVKGAIYAAELDQARADGRMTNVPYDPLVRVDTAWDLGVGDSTAIWFSQSLSSGEVRIIDYYEAQGEGLPHYLDLLTRKKYAYRSHYAPHDIQVRELTTGKSRLEIARGLGLTFRVTPTLPLEDGIHAVRMLIPKCWFDATKCQVGLEALGAYRRGYNTRLDELSPTPVHDWAEHGASAFRYLALNQRTPEDKKTRRGLIGPSTPRGTGMDYAL